LFPFLLQQGETLNTRIVPVRIPLDLFELIQESRKAANARKKGEPLTLSAWVRSACREKINHGLRSKKKGPGPVIVCSSCGALRNKEQIDHFFKPLVGKKQYVCKSCVTGSKNGNQPPLIDHGPKTQEGESTNVG
jgi:hypothetical protein